MNAIKDRRYVHATGPRNAKIVLVGEAPGEQEESTGQPFVGGRVKSLIILLMMPPSYDLSVHITNVFKVRPKDNQIGEFLGFLKKPPDLKWLPIQGASGPPRGCTTHRNLIQRIIPCPT